MWRSPDSERGVGRKFTTEELSVLIYPLDYVLDTLSFSSVRDVVEERIIQRLEKDELIVGLCEVFQALLTDKPVPPGEHPGYQEALIAELLLQMHGLVETERLAEGSDEEADADARKAAWTSYYRLCHPFEGGSADSLTVRLNLNVNDPDVHRSPKLTRDEWELMLVDGTLFGQFLWDTDWRWEDPLDLPEEATREVRGLLGLDLATVHRLPETPSPETAATAERYLRALARSID